MPTIGTTTRPAYVYDLETDTWIPVGTGPHTHTTAISDVTGLQAALDAELSLANYNAAGKNFLINGGFDIWQRGTSFASGGTGVYTADRWENTQSGNITGSQQTSGAPSGSRYYFRQTATSTGGFYTLSQYVETANSAALWGKTATASVKLRRNSTFNAETFFVIEKHATADIGNAGGWITIATTTIPATSVSVGTTTNDWTTFSVTAAIPNDGTANTIRVRHAYNVNPANGSVLDVGQFQLEVGSIATPFSRAGGTIQGERDACERYLPVIDGAGNYYVGGQRNSTNAIFPITFRVQPRVAPTGITISALSDFFMFNSSLGGYTPTSIAYNTAGLNTGALDVGVSGGTGAAVGDSVFFRANANAKIFFTGCEL